MCCGHSLHVKKKAPLLLVRWLGEEKDAEPCQSDLPLHESVTPLPFSGDRCPLKRPCSRETWSCCVNSGVRGKCVIRAFSLHHEDSARCNGHTQVHGGIQASNVTPGSHSGAGALQIARCMCRLQASLADLQSGKRGTGRVVPEVLGSPPLPRVLYLSGGSFSLCCPLGNGGGRATYR